ncbi:hypothetical protein N7470_009011 [Penicillium chermesinum]|nr:hypothetical protein N7470_009011 [Penicillium chermesinum]
MGRLVIEDTRSRYVSHVLWANLGDEVEELRESLYEPSEETGNSDDDFADRATPELSPSAGINASIMGIQTLESSLHSYHPPFRIFHLPSLINTCWDVLGSPEATDCNTEALMFSIYYASVISMSPQECEKTLGLPRPVALKQRRFAVEQAIARSNLLNTDSMVLLQAVALFVTALRNEDASRTCWSLTALLFHTARAMGLHRDGASFGLSPLETELRRRLWWNICLLDIRSAENDGCDPIVGVWNESFDTKFPLNVNDRDLSPDLKEPPPEREGITEMTLFLIRCEVVRVMWKTCYFPPMKNPKNELSVPELVALIKDLETRLEERYLKKCDLSIPLNHVCVLVARLLIARLFLIVSYPSRRKETAPGSTGIRDQLFLLSLTVLEISKRLATSPEFYPWNWHSGAHIQWHAILISLIEICFRPPSDECDRAWECIEVLSECWKMKEHRGHFWGPVKRLQAKARCIRELQKSQPYRPAADWKDRMFEEGHQSMKHSPSTVPASFATFSETNESTGWSSMFSDDSLEQLFEGFPHSSIAPFMPSPAGVRMLLGPGGIEPTKSNQIRRGSHEDENLPNCNACDCTPEKRLDCALEEIMTQPDHKS